MMTILLSLILFAAPVSPGAPATNDGAPAQADPFDKDAFVEALSEADVSVVNEAEADSRGGADECVAMTTARSARFTTCLHASPSGAQTTAWSRSDYERTVFQRGVVVVYLRNGASRRLVQTVDMIMTEDGS
jgi:hypothetical protein